ncbi:unnamed protein product [Bursaphelenchus okinawaensis]|uniref:Late endosomal/lysosomal adaptor and MAPK and MTOR activator 1 n=1 Tax=Bursaphelenchus okinawaensis TaxID=465554 RepID=A0A811LAT9_9BILA|nr:unnamed protein product [Bursaphelenchus okinawaensis]CAG9119785.1 unnamed protein product [Bursaphelenchus okinawaensis]
MNFLKKFCCCITDGEDDESYLIRNEETDDIFRSESVNVPSQNATGNGIPAGNRLTPPYSVGESVRSREQNEAALIHRILNTAQERIIDVNLDDNVGEVDVTQRSRAYSEAVRKHDGKKKKNSDDSAPLGHVLLDVGGQANQSNLNASNVTVNDVQLLNQVSEALSEAVRSDVGICPGEELVAYMDLDG